jgi:hypothetical protein
MQHGGAAALTQEDCPCSGDLPAERGEEKRNSAVAARDFGTSRTKRSSGVDSAMRGTRVTLPPDAVNKS